MGNYNCFTQVFYEVEYPWQPDSPITCTCITTRTHGLPCAHNFCCCTDSGVPVEIAAFHHHLTYNLAEPMIHPESGDLNPLELIFPITRERQEQSAGNLRHSSQAAANLDEVMHEQ